MSDKQPLNSPDESDDDNNIPVAFDDNPTPNAADIPSEIQKHTEPVDYAAEAGVMCNKCYNWFPIGVFGWAGGWLLLFCCILDMIIAQITFTQFFVIAALMCGGVLIVFVEMPAICLPKFFRSIQLSIYDWLKLLSRLWGRGVFSFLLVIMCYSNIDHENGEFRTIPWIAGLYLIAMMVLYIVFSKLAARKYNGLWKAINDTQIDMDDISIDDDQKDAERDKKIKQKKFETKFHLIDENNDGEVTTQNIAKLADGLKLELSNSEVHAIFAYLDRNCDGHLVVEDWVLMWLENDQLNWL